MCGIVGISWLNQRRLDADRIITNMMTAIHHRGPDSDGRSTTDFADVGFRRLSIVDLAGGTQPLSNEDGTVDCFLNGEIYNYADLRRDLVARGHRLHTHSDTEVLPHLYEDFGEAMFTRLNGMFSICIVDRTRRCMLVARDHFGIKQIYYKVTNDAVAFGSEMKGVLASGLFEPEIDRASLLPYLSMFYTPEPFTLVRGVLKVPPGHYMRLSAGKPPELTRFYELPVANGNSRISPAEAATRTTELLTDAVRLQLHADVPVGISLSGGLDSSVLTCLAATAKEAGSDPVALTISWPDTDPAELACAAELCRRYGLKQQILQPPGKTPLDELPLLAWIADEPIADPALYSQHCISLEASRYVKVLLSGAGGDELFGGYGSYFPTSKRRFFMSLPRSLQGAIAAVGGSWLDAEEIEAMIHYRDSRFSWHYRAMRNLNRDDHQELRRTLGESRVPSANLDALFNRYRQVDPQNQQMLADLQTYLPDQVLPMLDRATMASSIEGRVPFLDVPLVEFCFSISGQVKLGSPPVAKRLLKETAAPWLPTSITNRKKVGMPSPFPRLIAQARDGIVRSVLLAPESFVASVFGVAWLESLIASEQSAVANFRILYCLLVLELWHRRFIREKDYTRPSSPILDQAAFVR